MATTILLQHVSGSKANQAERFPLDGLEEITIGRDPASTIVFDAQRDDAVSRHHAVVRVAKHGDEPSFLISDLGSRNGTRVNGERITGDYELAPGDAIELGAGGPRFIFDVQPRPAHLIARTRVIGTAGAGATRVLNTMSAEPMVGVGATASNTAGVKVGPSRDTVVRMISEQRQSTNKIWIYSLAGILALIGFAGGGLYYTYYKEHRQAVADLANAQAALSSKIANANADVEQKFGMSSQDIAHKYGNATVYIYVHWRLFDRESGKPLYQKTVSIGGENVPCYVKLKNGNIVRWLTTEDEERTNVQVGGAGSGSGFVINREGFILTNKHVAAGWAVKYDQYPKSPSGQVVVYDELAKPAKDMPRHLFNVSTWQDEFKEALAAWTPDTGGIVFWSQEPVPLSDSSRQFEGRNEALEVRFPGSALSVDARLVRASVENDAAEIKIDTQQNLSYVELASDNAVSVGERVTVMGYPGASVKTFAVIRVMEAGDSQEHLEVIPEPTITEGLIARLSGAEKQVGQVTTVGGLGDVYQLTVATGPGNSGGPVFNAQGKVIGLFTYGSRLSANVTFAVPIKYGRDLLQVQRNN